MKHLTLTALLASTCLMVVAPANAALIVTTDLFSPTPVPGTTTSIAIAGATPTRTIPFIGPGFSITFSGLSAGQGIVKGAAPAVRAIPIAGAIPPGPGGIPTYLTGDFGSTQTAIAAQAGNFLSTGGPGGAITMSFTTPQTALGLLWGSVDRTNRLQFFNGLVSVGSLTGTQVLATADGNQGPGGSTYATINSSLVFNRVVATSQVVSFEFSGVIGSTANIVEIPEPVSLALLGSGLLAMGLIRRRNS